MDAMETSCIVNYMDIIDVSCCNKHPQVSIAYQGPVWILLWVDLLGDFLSNEGSKPLPSCSSMISQGTMEGKEKAKAKALLLLTNLSSYPFTDLWWEPVTWLVMLQGAM